MALTTVEITTYVETMLGKQSLDVEIDSTDIAQCLKAAFRLINRYFPAEGRSALSVSSTVWKYEITHTNLIGVTQVDFVREEAGVEVVDNPFQSWRAARYDESTIPEYERELAMSEEYRKVIARDVEWTSAWEDNKYYLYVYVPKNVTYNVSYIYKYARSADDDGLATLQPQWEEWVCEYVLARAKLVLARKLRKFQGIPNAEGSMETLDFDNLKDEADSALMDLVDDIKARQTDPPPIFD